MESDLDTDIPPKTLLGKIALWIHKHQTPAVITFMLTILGTVLGIYSAFFTDIKPDVAAVVNPDGDKTRIQLSQMSEDMKRLLSPPPDTNRRLENTAGREQANTQNKEPNPIRNKRDITPPAPQALTSNQPASTIRSAQPSPCEATITNATSIPFYLSVSGPPEINLNEIEGSIRTYLPSADFYASDRPECATLRIKVKVGLSWKESTKKSYTAEDITAVSEFEYISSKSHDREVTTLPYSENGLVEANYNSFQWPHECVVAKSIAASLADPRFLEFIAKEFGRNVTMATAAESLMSKCGAG